MSDVKTLKEKTTMTLHSLLLSGGALSVRDLENDYRNIIGGKIPYQEMGYANLENYLRDCPQKFSLYWSGSIKMIKHVTSEETEHIERMINAQKKKPGDKKRKARSRNSYQRYPKPRNQPEPTRLTPVVHNTLRGKIKGLLYDYRTGLLGSNFDVAYSKRFGGQVNFRDLGFESLLKLFQSMSDIVHIEELPCGYKLHPKTAGNVNRPVATAAATHNRPRSLPPRMQKSNATRQVSSSSTSQGKESVSPPSAKHNNNLARPKKSPGQQQKSSTNSQQAPVTGPVFAEEDLWDDESYDMSGVNLGLQKEIQQVLAKLPDGVWASEFPYEYRRMFRRELDWRNQGYDSVISLMSALPHLVTIHRPNNKDWRLYDCRINQEPRDVRRRKDSEKSSSSNHKEPQSFNTAPPIDDNLRETIRQVLAHYPAGVALPELPDMYQELTGRELDPSTHGYATLESFVTSLTDTISMQYKQGTGQVLLFPKHTESPPRKDKLLKLKRVSPPPAAKSTQSRRREIPADAVGPGSGYRLQEIPRNVLDQKIRYMEVYVSTVTNPSTIWVQVKGENTEELENVMDELEYFYKNRHNAEEYALPDELITVGQVCAAIYPNDNDWHRCTISGFVGTDFVQVYYVDYGSTNVVTRKSLKFLQMSFLKLPAQALRAKLANITPIEKEWTGRAKDRLLQLVTNRALIALITDISQDNVLSLCLTDTSTDNDIHINDLLVYENLAKMELHESPPEEVMEESTPQEVPVIDTDYRTEEPPPAEEVDGERHVQFVQLTDDYSLHILRWNDLAYVTSYEISNLLWPGRDIVRSMMRQKKLTFTKVVLAREEHTNMFEEMTENEVGGIEDLEGNPKSHVTIFELASVVKILDAFNHPCERLKAAIQQQIDLFNPEDAYWKGESDSDDLDDDLESDADEDDYKYGRQTLETALQSLQFRRKKILQAMQDMNSTNSARLVEDLQNVEHQLVDIKKRIRELEKLEQANDAAKGSASKKLTEEEELVVCAIVSEQNDSYIAKNSAALNTKPMSPMRSVPPLQPSTPRAGVKTNPVAPMPAEPRPTETSTAGISSTRTTPSATVAPGMQISGAATPDAANNPLMVMPFVTPGVDQEYIRQQMMYNMLAMQAMMQQQGGMVTPGAVPGIDPAVAGSFMHQQHLLAAQMQGLAGYPMGTANVGRGAPMGGSAPVNAGPSQVMGASLGLPAYSQGSAPNFGRGRCATNVDPTQPGGRLKKE